MFLFYFLAAFILWQGIQSLCGGFRYLAYVRGELAKPLPDFTPFVSIIVPCRGIDQGLHQNLAALFKQNHPAYEIIFVVDSTNDSSLVVIENVRREFGGVEAISNIKRANVTSRVVIAGQASNCGQKVHNLRAAVCETDVRSEVFVFVDTDARPAAHWLRALVAPLVDKNIGAATGYRWFFPQHDTFASHLRSVWNASIASALGADMTRNFCWGGSTAIRRATFEKLKVSDAWRGALSDDFALTRTLQGAKLPIYFVPQCLTASHEDCTFAELFEFTTRQMKITRVYAEHLWRLSLIGSLLFTSVFYGGIALVITRAALGFSYPILLALLTTIYLLGAGKAYIRLRAVRLPLATHFPRGLSLLHTYAAHILLWHLAAAIYAYNALAASVSRRIVWRSITYELKSPTETVIIRNVSLTRTKPPLKSEINERTVNE